MLVKLIQEGKTASKHLKPLQGLKHFVSESTPELPDASKHLKPLQGLKLIRMDWLCNFATCFKTSKTLTGIET